jgi:hypothetical protein
VDHRCLRGRCCLQRRRCLHRRGHELPTRRRTRWVRRLERDSKPLHFHVLTQAVAAAIHHLPHRPARLTAGVGCRVAAAGSRPRGAAAAGRGGPPNAAGRDGPAGGSKLQLIAAVHRRWGAPLVSPAPPRPAAPSAVRQARAPPHGFVFLRPAGARRHRRRAARHRRAAAARPAAARPCRMRRLCGRPRLHQNGV